MSELVAWLEAVGENEGIAEREAREEEETLALREAVGVSLLDTLPNEVTVAASTGEGLTV